MHSVEREPYSTIRKNNCCFAYGWSLRIVVKKHENFIPFCETPSRWKEKWMRRGSFASLFQRKYMFPVAKETVIHSCSSFHPWVTSSADHVRTSRVENFFLKKIILQLSFNASEKNNLSPYCCYCCFKDPTARIVFPRAYNYFNIVS